MRPVRLVFLVLSTLALPARAQAPSQISYQGLLEHNDAPVTDPSATLTLRLFDDSTAGNLVWTEAHNSVAITDGLFALTLGSVSPLSSLDFHEPLWLEVEMSDSGEALTPRTPLTATPYALSLVLPQVHNAPVGGTAFWINNTDLGDGIRGEAQGSGARGVIGQSSAFLGDGVGVYGLSNGAQGTGVYGEGQTGVRGENPSFGAEGALGTNGFFIAAGVFGTIDPGFNRYAGYFDGNVIVTDTLTVSGALNVVGTKNFRIDHPLDPANRYLYHFAMESSEVLNVYSGNVTTDAEGYTTVQLPDWFEAVNTDFRYQLTVLGTFAQAIVAEEIRGNRFVIRTNEPGVRVSWQVTGVRNDPGLRANPPVAEADKPPAERGTYVQPEVYGRGE